jgi:hypothetical protein
MRRKKRKVIDDRKYEAGLRWIAYNDNAGAETALDVKDVEAYITTIMLADMFETEPPYVAEDIVRIRRIITFMT